MPSRDTGRSSQDEAKLEYERARDEAGRLASSAAETARNRGREEIDTAKENTAEHAEDFADALDATADDLESANGNQALAGYGHDMASMVRRFAGGLRERDIEDLAGELAMFARRNPGSFLAGSVALGFGLSRFMKATSGRPEEAYRHGRDEYGFDEEDFDEEYYLDEEEDIDTTLQPSPSPEVSTMAAGSTWPEDRGNERPGSASSTQHTSPAAETSGSEYPQGATGAPASSGSNVGGGSSTFGQTGEIRRDEEGRK